MIIGPFISRNFNKFNSDNSSLIVSPLVEEGIVSKDNVIITTTNNSLKSSRVFDIIDSEINLMEDQCAIIISDSENISSKSKLISRFPNAEVVDIGKMIISIGQCAGSFVASCFVQCSCYLISY